MGSKASTCVIFWTVRIFFCCAFLRIINLFPYVQPELSSLREDLLREFSIDDLCPLGFPLTMDIPEKVCLVETHYISILCFVRGYWCNYFCILQDASFVSTDDDYIPDIFDCQIKENPRLSMELPSLLSANQLLELVWYPFLAPINCFCFKLCLKLFSYQYQGDWHRHRVLWM